MAKRSRVAEPRYGAVVLGLAFLITSCQAQRQLTAQETARQGVIAEIKAVQRSLGFEPTGNFLDPAGATEAVYRCYYTGKFEIPESYEGLRLREGTRDGCAVDEQKYDVFFYPIEAVASGNEPISGSLADASEERLAVVVSHEDFHNQESLQQLPEALHEAAATLVGFLTAAEFAREQSGPESQQHQRLAREAEVFLRKAEVVNAYHDRAKQLYASLRRGALSGTAVLAAKTKLFEDLSNECSAIIPAPATFNRCPAVLNNAALAFDRTYTKSYPLLYELHKAYGSDVKTTIAVLSKIASQNPPTDSEAEQQVRDLIAAAR